MRKSTIPGFGTTSGLSPAGSWLPLEDIATAELSSEDPQHPFELALRADTDDGWRAGLPGPQVIRLRFDTPQSFRRIHLQFQEAHVERSQEITVFATSGSARKELVRQQWVFSPNGATTETEDYFFDVQNVLALELEIDPGRHDKSVFASLQLIQVG